MNDVAFVLLSVAKLAQPTAIISAYHRIVPNAQPLTIEGKDGRVLTIHVRGGDDVIVALAPIPIPNGEAEDNVDRSVSAFFREHWTLPPYHAHLVVTQKGKVKRSRYDQLTAFTRVVAAIAEANDAVGVYWGGGHATHDPKFFVEMADPSQESTGLPMLWNGIEITHEGDRVSLLTLGMQQLNLPNIHLTAPRAQGNDAVADLFDCASYLIQRGSALPAGDTVGRTAGERIPVRYEPSPAGDGRQVWRIDL
ncbi:MAG: DUF4261 domain-containing protein [Vulcanimicrobiaceae bacterium]|jgi:hypothetical protein